MSRKIGVIAVIALVALLAFATFAFAQSSEPAPDGADAAPATCPLTGQEVDSASMQEMHGQMTANGNMEEMRKLCQQRMGRAPQGGGEALAAPGS